MGMVLAETIEKVILKGPQTIMHMLRFTSIVFKLVFVSDDTDNTKHYMIKICALITNNLRYYSITIPAKMNVTMWIIRVLV